MWKTGRCRLCSVVMVIFHATCWRCRDMAQKPSIVELLQKCTQFTLATAWVKASSYFVAKSHQTIGVLFCCCLWSVARVCAGLCTPCSEHPWTSLLTCHSPTHVCAPRGVHGHHNYLSSLWSLLATVPIPTLSLPAEKDDDARVGCVSKT